MVKEGTQAVGIIVTAVILSTFAALGLAVPIPTMLVLLFLGRFVVLAPPPAIIGAAVVRVIALGAAAMAASPMVLLMLLLVLFGRPLPVPPIVGTVLIGRVVVRAPAAAVPVPASLALPFAALAGVLFAPLLPIAAAATVTVVAAVVVAPALLLVRLVVESATENLLPLRIELLAVFLHLLLVQPADVQFVLVVLLVLLPRRPVGIGQLLRNCPFLHPRHDAHHRRHLGRRLGRRRVSAATTTGGSSRSRRHRRGGSGRRRRRCFPFRHLEGVHRAAHDCYSTLVAS